MLTGKQRSRLRGMAHSLDTLYQIGKQGITPEVTESINEALNARELIKITLLNNCELEAKEAAEILSGRTRSEVIQVIGRKIVLYKRSQKKPIIDI